MGALGLALEPPVFRERARRMRVTWPNWEKYLL